MRSPARTLLALVSVLAASCDRSPSRGVPMPSRSSGPVQTATGYITEIEFGKLSLRTVDGRALIFELEGISIPQDRLQDDMAKRNPVTITYRADAGRLVPLGTEEPCPGEKCPPPYSPPRPSGL